MPHAPGTFSWFECGTKDPAAAKAFYTQLFGWNAVDVPMPGEMGGTYTLLKVGDEDVAGMYELSGPHFEGVPPHWMPYVTVADADETAARAKSLGAKILQAPMDVPGVGRMAFFTDPTGANLSIFQFGEHEGASDKSNLGWSELHTTDIAKAKAFYTELFNWNAKEDASGHYTEFQVGGRSIAGMMAIPPEQREHMPPNWLIYAMVDDCDASMSKAAELGAHVIVPATDVADVGRFGVIADPTGAAIAMIKLTGHG